MRLCFLAATMAVLSTNVVARADQFSYDFSYPSYDISSPYVTFSLISPTLITTESDFLPTTQCTFFGHSCYEVRVAPTGDPDYPFIPNNDPGFVAHDTTPGYTSALFAAYPSSFFTVGSHTFDGDTLVIRDIPSSITPEPSTFILLATGALAFAGAVRRRLA